MSPSDDGLMSLEEFFAEERDAGDYDEMDDGRYRPQVTDVVDREAGRPRVLSDQCTTCVFRSGNPMRLRPGRLAQMIRDAVEAGTWIVCHSTLPYHPKCPGWQAVCKGFYDGFADRSKMLIIAERLGGVTFVTLPNEDDTQTTTTDAT